MTSSRPAWIPRARLSASGASDSVPSAYPASRNSLEAGAQPAFPPSLVVEVKALACELPARRGVPLARWSLAELRREVVAHGLVAQISGATLWRWLSQDALRPWRHRSWIFPRDPEFAAKAGRLLDLYERRWQGLALVERLVAQVMGSAHRGQPAIARLHAKWPPIVLVHTPIHASWLLIHGQAIRHRNCESAYSGSAHP